MEWSLDFGKNFFIFEQMITFLYFNAKIPLLSREIVQFCSPVYFDLPISFIMNKTLILSKGFNTIPPMKKFS